MTSHLQKRLLERYNITLTQEVYLGWRSQIKGKSSSVVDLGDGQYQVWYGSRRVFLGFRNGEITTALPPNNILTDILKKVLESKRKLKLEETTKKEHAKTVIFRRPFRDESRLRELKETANRRMG